MFIWRSVLAEVLKSGPSDTVFVNFVDHGGRKEGVHVLLRGCFCKFEVLIVGVLVMRALRFFGVYFGAPVFFNTHVMHLALQCSLCGCNGA